MPPNAKVLLIPIELGWVDFARGAQLLVGVDPDLDRLDAARALAEAEGLTNCLFVEGSLEAIPWRDAYFTHAVLGSGASEEVRRVMVAEWRNES